MTDDEVQLIYNYLHENYEYRDGELIRITDGSNRRLKDTNLGHFKFRQYETGFQTVIKVNDINYPFFVNHLIWLFHNKQKPEIIIHKDKNPTNMKIENLISLTKEQYKLYKATQFSGFTFRYNKYHVKLKSNDKWICLGGYDSPEIAHYVYIKAKEMDSQGMDKFEIKNNLAYLNPSIKKGLTNKNKFPGVYKVRDSEKYYARFRKKDKKTFYSSCYNTPEEAHTAYLKAKEEYRFREIKKSPIEGNIPREDIKRAVASVSEARKAGEKVMDKYSKALTNLADR